MSTRQTLGKYEIRRQLGRGAMGIVYEGWDPVIKRQVAIKTVRVSQSADDESADELARFRREAEAAGRLHHPNIVGVFDYGETGDVAYIVMEFVDGATLKSLVDQNEVFPLPKVVQIMENLLAGLQFSHDHGVVHRDIKPANLMLTRSGQAKITDFGIARLDSSNITQAGTVLGTPAYMSPEQLVGKVADARSDIYASGVLLYQLLTGKRPFDGNMSAIMDKALNTDAPLPSQVSISAPRSFDAVIRRAMAKRPGDRFASARAFADAIGTAFAASAPSPDVARLDDDDDATIVSLPRPKLPVPAAAPKAAPVPASAPEPARSSFRLPAIIGSGVAALAVLGGVAYFLLTGPSPSPAPSHDEAVQPVTPPPTAPPPASVAANPPEPEPNQTAALAPPAIPPSVSPPATVAPPTEDVPHVTPPPPVPPAIVTPPPAPTAVVPPTNVTPPPAPAAVVPPTNMTPPPAPAQVVASPLDQARAAAESVPCSVLNVSAERVSGFARSGPELDRMLQQVQSAGRAQESITRVEPFACAPMTAVTGLLRQSWASNPQIITIRTDRQDPISGTRFKIVADTMLPLLLVDFYQADGSVQHLVRPAPGARSTPHTASVIAPAPGSGLIVAIGSAKPLDPGVRPETESAADYLAFLQPQLDRSTRKLAADIAVLTVRPVEQEAPRVQRINPVLVKPRPVDSAIAKVPLSHTQALHSSRCSNIVSRAQLGETLSDAELAALRTECRS